ncbi:helix-turn-helix domain-containing protein [Croceimicrobium sp.]|uniref:helix-turn-helix domain-containing protein n=1 Tax=Croceimicrobium sp. TaxID=2828340 RepID=UPI003BAD6ED9
MTKTQTLQMLFVDRLQELIPPGQSLAPVLSEALDISMDSAYRRINGKTTFSLEEALILARQYNLSLDGLTDPTQQNAHFSFQDLQPSFSSFSEYLDLLLNNLNRLAAAPDARLYYSCLDIPIFFNLGSPQIAAFKMFYWMHSILEVEELQTKIFEPELIPDYFIEKGKLIYDTYCKIPSIELWTTNTLNSTLRQIEYYNNAGHIRSPEVNEALFADLQIMLDRLNTMAEKGTKVIDRVPTDKERDNYKLYESDIELTGNGALAMVGEHRLSFIGHLTFHTLTSDHPALNQKTLLWYERLVRKANLISSVSAKYRYQFISHLQADLEATKARILG